MWSLLCGVFVLTRQIGLSCLTDITRTRTLTRPSHTFTRIIAIAFYHNIMAIIMLPEVYKYVQRPLSEEHHCPGSHTLAFRLIDFREGWANSAIRKKLRWISVRSMRFLPTNDSAREATTEAIFRQWQSRGSGTPWAASTCEYAHAYTYSVSNNDKSALRF